MNVLVTGGAGYIGSHAVKRLLEDGHAVLAVDDLSRGHRGAIEALRAADAVRTDALTFERCDIAETERLATLIRDHGIDAAMHFAALAYVGESVTEPLLYHRVNTAGALSLLSACDAAGVTRFVFSSTCATYGEPEPEYVPIPETCPQAPINPYGAAKLAFERILADYAHAKHASGEPFAYAALRYFNVCGCDPGGLIGEDHRPETHLIPVVLQAALGRREAITIFGTDYSTPDGTCVRDYVHVNDLIDAHVLVMNTLDPNADERATIFNLGIGNGLSVRAIIDAAKEVTGVDFRVREGARRPGDPPELFADPAKIDSALGWRARHTDVREAIEHAWVWMKANPEGYGG